MRRIVGWTLAVAAVLVALALVGALVVDAPMPARPPAPAAVDCEDDEAVARADAEEARQASLGLRTAGHDCG